VLAGGSCAVLRFGCIEEQKRSGAPAITPSPNSPTAPVESRRLDHPWNLRLGHGRGRERDTWSPSARPEFRQ